LLVVALAAFAVLALSACDPSETSGRTNGVNLEVLVNADGSGTAQMYLDDAERSDAQLHSWGEAVGARLFPSATAVQVRVDPNSGGYPFVVIDAEGLYQPGPQPQVSLDTREAVGWLLANGTKTVDIYIDSPRVPLTSTWTPPRGADEFSWVWQGVTDGSGAPVGVIVMSPEPWLGILPVLLTVLAGVLLVLSFVAFRRRTHRLVAMLLASAALIATGIVVMQAGAVLPNNLGVAGLASSTWVQVASLLTLLSLLLAPAAVVLLVLYAVWRPSPKTPVTAVSSEWPAPPVA
jgi:uncharacterized membrane protein YbaN (DUF454 family)